MTPLLDVTLARLASHRETRAIPERLADAKYDRETGERICRLVERVCIARGGSYEAAVDDFIRGCTEFLARQRRLERTGRYACSSFEEARRTVYDDPSVMETTYLYGLLLSQALVENHARFFGVFRRGFCRPPTPSGRVLEVPVGSGLYLAEFSRMNPGWAAHGVDISASAVEFARTVARAGGAPAVELQKADVFSLGPERGVFDRIICGELLEHVEKPGALLETLKKLLGPGGLVFLTTAIWVESPDHVYLFESATEVRRLLGVEFAIIEEWVLPLEGEASPDAERIPINYACVMAAR